MATPLKKRQSLSVYSCTNNLEQAAKIRKFPKQIRAKKTKKFSFLKLVKILISWAFLGAFCYYCLPYNYFHLMEPVYVNRYLNRNIKFDVAPYVNPTRNYLYNSSLGLNETFEPLVGKSHKHKNVVHLITPTNLKSYEMASVFSNGENVPLKENLLNLGREYPFLKSSVYVFDFNTGKSVEIEATKAIPVASMIKIPILFELFRQIDSNKDMNINKEIIFEDIYKTSGSGSLQYGTDSFKTTLNHMANLMITDSDNSATNLILDYIGGKDALNRSFRNWGLKNSIISNWLPDLDGTNKMSAKDLATVLYNLDNPMFLSVRSREYIKDYMSSVKTDTLLPQGLEAGSVIYHKTGDIGNYVGDAGIIYTKSGHKYVAVVIVKRAYNDHRAKDYIQRASKIIYKNVEG